MCSARPASPRSRCLARTPCSLIENSRSRIIDSRAPRLMRRHQGMRVCASERFSALTLRGVRRRFIGRRIGPPGRMVNGRAGMTAGLPLAHGAAAKAGTSHFAGVSYGYGGQRRITHAGAGLLTRMMARALRRSSITGYGAIIVMMPQRLPVGKHGRGHGRGAIPSSLLVSSSNTDTTTR